MFDYFNRIFNRVNDVEFLFKSLNINEVILIGMQLFVIGIFAFTFYKKFIKGTHSEKLIKGIMMLLLAWIFSKILIRLDLQILGYFLDGLVSVVIFGLVVIFQPELRRFLGYLGQPGFFKKNIFNIEVERESKNIVTELTDSVKYLSKSRTGALMVVQNTSSFSGYLEVGTKINADVSTELILTIFHPNTALHDGAVVIYEDKILAAGVLLPLTDDPKLSWQYGTRHRAAIGMSELSDVHCIVVSEETGDISVSTEGKLEKFETIDEFRLKLEKIFGVDADLEQPKVKKAAKINLNTLLNANIESLSSSNPKEEEEV